MHDRLLSATEAAALLQLPLATVRQWLWSGRLPGERVGGATAGWRIKEADLLPFLAAQPPSAGLERSAPQRGVPPP